MSEPTATTTRARLCSGVLLVSFVAIVVRNRPGLQSNSVLIAVVLAAVGAGLLWKIQVLRHKASAKLALIVLAPAAALTALEPDLQVVVESLLKFDRVFIMLLGIGFLKAGFKKIAFHEVINGLLTRVRQRLRMTLLYVITTVATLFLSMGSAGILSSLLEESGRPKESIARAVMRGTCIANLLAPCTAAAAAVASVYTTVHPLDALLLGTPLAAAALLMGSFTRGQLGMGPTAGAGNPLRPRLALFVTAYIAVVVGMIRLTNLSVIEVISILALALGGAIILFAEGPRKPSFADTSEQVWDGTCAEVLLFAASGFLYGALDNSGLIDRLQDTGIYDNPIYLGLIVIIAIPALAIMGIHPMILFTSIAPAVTPATTGLDASILYLGWIAMFFIAMLSSPVSILTVLVSSGLNLSPVRVSVRCNLLYCMIFAVICLAYLGAMLATGRAAASGSS